MIRKSLSDRVYYFLTLIPEGKVSTYKSIAEYIGSKKAYRAVGNILNKNKYPDKFLCYKVVRSDGAVGGYAKGQNEKIKLLKKDGILIKNGRIVDLNRYLFKRAGSIYRSR